MFSKKTDKKIVENKNTFTCNENNLEVENFSLNLKTAQLTTIEHIDDTCAQQNVCNWLNQCKENFDSKWNEVDLLKVNLFSIIF